MIGKPFTVAAKRLVSKRLHNVADKANDNEDYDDNIDEIQRATNFVHDTMPAKTKMLFPQH